MLYKKERQYDTSVLTIGKCDLGGVTKGHHEYLPTNLFPPKCIR